MTTVCVSYLEGCPGPELAGKLAEELGLPLLDEQLWQRAAGSSGLPVEKLRIALSEPPTLFGMTRANRRRCLAHLRLALLESIAAGDCVYCLPLGHYLVSGVAHLVKVRLAASVEQRVAGWSAAQGLDGEAARRRLKQLDGQQRLLAQLLFAASGDDDELFDLTLNCAQLAVDEAAGVVAAAARQSRYLPTSYSRQVVADLLLAARVTVVLIELDAEVQVGASGGKVQVKTRAGRRRLDKLRARAEAVEGVGGVEIERLGELLSGGGWPLR